MASVPTQAITLTIPTLMGSREHLLHRLDSPQGGGRPKRSLEGPIATSCPGSILRRQAKARLMLDSEAASLLKSVPSR